MYQLSEQEIDFIRRDLARLGIRTQSIRDNLLDHICILLEQEVEQSEEFEAVYRTLLPKFYNHNLKEIEAQARVLVLSRRHLVLGKGQFFVFLFVLMICPFLIYLLSNLPAVWTSATGNFPKALWAPALAYALWPLSSLLVLFLIPDSLDPPISRRAKVVIGIRPILAIINY